MGIQKVRKVVTCYPNDATGISPRGPNSGCHSRASGNPKVKVKNSSRLSRMKHPACPVGRGRPAVQAGRVRGISAIQRAWIYAHSGIQASSCVRRRLAIRFFAPFWIPARGGMTPCGKSAKGDASCLIPLPCYHISFFVPAEGGAKESSRLGKGGIDRKKRREPNRRRETYQRAGSLSAHGECDVRPDGMAASSVRPVGWPIFPAPLLPAPGVRRVAFFRGKLVFKKGRKPLKNLKI